jgi:hypothetical protein
MVAMMTRIKFANAIFAEERARHIWAAIAVDVWSSVAPAWMSSQRRITRSYAGDHHSIWHFCGVRR